MRISSAWFILGIGAVVLGAQGCAAPPPEVEAQGATTSNVEGGEDTCGAAAGQARAKATFDRTTSCAIDAATAGVGEKLELAGKILGDTKTIATQVRALAGAIQVKDLNTARAVMCVRAIGGYAVDNATKEAMTAAAVGLDAAELDAIYETAASGVSAGVTDVFKAYGDVEKDGSVANIVAFITAMAGSLTNVAQFATSCGTILQPIASGISIPSLAKYSSALANIGTIGSIINCSSAVVQNAVDVGTELYCLGQDYQRIAEQTAAIRRATDELCSSFGDYTQNLAMLPIVESGQDKAVCADVVRHWGFCVADAKRAGFFGETALSCDECKLVCNGYVNGAGDHAYLEPVLAGAYSKTGGADRNAVQRMVSAAGTCVYGTPDYVQPCINTCLGRNANNDCRAN